MKKEREKKCRNVVEKTEKNPKTQREEESNTDVLVQCLVLFIIV